MNDRTIILPQPEELSEREKEDAMGAYLMMFAAWGIGLPLPLVNLIASVVYFFVNKKTSKFVAFHSLQSLLSQIPVSCFNSGLIAWLIAAIVSGFVFSTAFFIYLIFVVLINILYIIFSIVALVHARKGRFYYFPLFGGLSFNQYYGAGAENRFRKTEQWENKPPEGF